MFSNFIKLASILLIGLYSLDKSNINQFGNSDSFFVMHKPLLPTSGDNIYTSIRLLSPKDVINKVIYRGHGQKNGEKHLLREIDITGFPIDSTIAFEYHDYDTLQYSYEVHLEGQAPIIKGAMITMYDENPDLTKRGLLVHTNPYYATDVLFILEKDSMVYNQNLDSLLRDMIITFQSQAKILYSYSHMFNYYLSSYDHDFHYRPDEFAYDYLQAISNSNYSTNSDMDVFALIHNNESVIDFKIGKFITSNLNSPNTFSHELNHTSLELFDEYLARDSIGNVDTLKSKKMYESGISRITTITSNHKRLSVEALQGISNIFVDSISASKFCIDHFGRTCDKYERLVRSSENEFFIRICHDSCTMKNPYAPVVALGEACVKRAQVVLDIKHRNYMENQ